MYPAAEDNYGYDACAILCLPCVPNIIVIATQGGVIYHCVVLEGEDDDEQMVCVTSESGCLRERHCVQFCPLFCSQGKCQLLTGRFT